MTTAAYLGALHVITAAYLRALHVITTFILLNRTFTVWTVLGIGDEPQTVGGNFRLLFRTGHCLQTMSRDVTEIRQNIGSNAVITLSDVALHAFSASYY